MNKNIKLLSALLLVSLAIGGAGCVKSPVQTQNENTEESSSVEQNRANDNLTTESDKNQETEKNDAEVKDESSGVEDLSAQAVVTVTPKESSKDFIVQINGIEVGKIKRSDVSNVSLEKTMKQYAYIGFNYEGLGGRILYAGPDEVYRVNLKTNELEKIYSAETGFFCDVSPDETKIAYIGTNPDGYELDVKNLQTNEKKTYIVYSLGEYDLMGDATFSPEGDKIALGAASSDPEQEKSAIYMVMLDSEKVIKITEKEGVSAYYVKQWLNNDEVEYTK